MTETAASDPLDPDALVQRLGYRPQHILESMIAIELGATAAWPARTSSVGVLDRLPPELLMEVLRVLDLQSTVRFASVSFLGRSLAHASCAYRDLATFAPEALRALGMLGLAGAHLVTALHAALRAKQCTSCNNYGGFSSSRRPSAALGMPVQQPAAAPAVSERRKTVLCSRPDQCHGSTGARDSGAWLARQDPVSLSVVAWAFRNGPVVPRLRQNPAPTVASRYPRDQNASCTSIYVYKMGWPRAHESREAGLSQKGFLAPHSTLLWAQQLVPELRDVGQV